MAKKRTRAQKIRAQRKLLTQPIRSNTYQFEPAASNVKGQFEKASVGSKLKTEPSDSLVKSEESGNLKLIKRDLLKSLYLASFILCLEVVLYLLWYK